MKRIIALLFAATLIFSCAACNSSSDTEETKSSDNNTEPAVSIAGTTTDKAYTNDFADLTFKLPESWTFFDNAALASLSGADEELSVKEIADTKGAAYDMMALNPLLDASVSLVYENVTITSGKALTAREYLDNVVRPAVEQTSQSSLVEVFTVSFGGNDYIKYTIEIADLNNPLFQTHYIRDIDNYIVHITATIPQKRVDEVNFDSMFS